MGTRDRSIQTSPPPSFMATDDRIFGKGIKGLMVSGTVCKEAKGVASEGAAFLRNSWYAAAFSQELEETPLLGRVILSRPLLLYRDVEGRAAAIANLCPHRFVPLSMGRLVDGQVRCGYHGLGFDGTGKCVHNPHGPIGALSVDSFPVEERCGIFWVWMGRADAADPALIPAFGNLDEEQHHIRRGYMHGRANYELMTDNILDLSHIEFLHPALGTEAVSRAGVETRQDGVVITTTRAMKDEVLPPGLAYVYKSGSQRVNRTMVVTWYPASNMVLQVTVDPVDEAENWHSSTQTLHLFTPETEGTTHYFYVASLPRATADEEITDTFYAALSKAFITEDKPMIDAQALMIGSVDIMSLKPALLPTDKAAVLARRTLGRLIAGQ